MKYELTDDKILFKGKTLSRIRALKDFSSIKKGDLGGYVEKYTNLSQTGDCWVYSDAQVCDAASIFDNAKVRGDSEIDGNAQVYENAEICGNAKVYDNAKIKGNATVFGRARIFAFAEIDGDAKVRGDSEIDGYAQVYENAEVYGYAEICGNAKVYGKAEVYGYAEICGNAKVYGDAVITGDYVANGSVKINTGYYDHLPRKSKLQVNLKTEACEARRSLYEVMSKVNKTTECECGAHHVGITDPGPGHMRYCKLWKGVCNG